MSKQVGISVEESAGQVIVCFESPMEWLEFSPQQALEFAKAVAEKACKAGGIDPHKPGSIILPARLNS